MALSDIAGVSNSTLWDLARKEDPTFASHTSKATADLFTERGFAELTRSNVNAVNDWFNVSLRIAFQMLNVADARNPLADSGLVEVYNTPNGGYAQRMAMSAVKPVSAAYRGLQDGDSLDPYIVRKSELTERFYQQNFDFQNVITHQDFNVKTIFISEYGMGQVLAGILQGLQVSYTKQEYYNTLECLNAAINESGLQDSQVINLAGWTDVPSVDNLKDFIRTSKNIARNMDSVASTSKFNTARFDTISRPGEMVMLVRPDILTEIELLNALNAPGNVSIPFEVRAIENFGGMVPVYVDGDDSTDVYPVYSDKLGIQVGWSTTEGDTTARYTDEDISWVDTNDNVLAVIAQRGMIFENAQNPYTVQTIYNPRGLYQNYWASRPGTAIVYDRYRDLIVIRKGA